MKKPGKELAVKESTGITTAELESKGIKTSLSQNDLVEIIADNKYQKAVEELSALAKQWEEFEQRRKDIEQFYIQQTKEELRKKKILSEEDLNSLDKLGLRFDGEKSKYVNKLSIDENGDSVKITLSSIWFHHTFRDAKEKKLTKGVFTKDFLVGDDTKENKTPHFKITEYNRKNIVISAEYDLSKNKEIDKYIKDFDTYQKRIEEVFNSIPGREGASTKTLSISKFTREARVAINTNILKSQAPEILEALGKVTGSNI